jgi:8-oxo-dGTP pyrophosphatase MutT (NUDIX family)/phosphohistidine phosphatase SixA
VTALGRFAAAGALPPDADVHAAGAVLWRPDEMPVALVHRPRYDDWSLPKGKLDAGESMPAAAVREVAEETGFAARLGSALGEVRYDVPEGRKVVRYWTAEALHGRFEPSAEVDELRWCAVADAAELLSHAHDVEVLRRSATIGLPSATVLLVRHAKAGSRSQWDGDDDLRPLSGRGREQARQLAGLLALFGPDRIVSAPPLRCRETVAPLAATLGVTVREEPLLGEDGYWLDPAAGLARLRALAGRPGVTVVCSQGEVIPDLVGALAVRTDRPLGVDPDDVPARKGSTWLLAMRGGEVLSADYYPSPAG